MSTRIVMATYVLALVVATIGVVATCLNLVAPSIGG